MLEVIRLRPLVAWHSVRYRYLVRRGLRCYGEAASIARKHGLWNRYCESLAMMASTLHLLKKYKEETANLKEALRQLQPLGRNYLLIGVYGQLGRAYLYLKDYRCSQIAVALALKLVQPSDPLISEVEDAKADLRGAMGSGNFDSTWPGVSGLSDAELLRQLMECQLP